MAEPQPRRAGSREETAALGGWSRGLLVALLLLSALPRLAFATRQLDASKHWDERFNLTNIAVILGRGTYEPSNYFYGALSYLPQLALFAGADALADRGWEAVAVFREEGGFTPFAYLLVRSLQVLWGVLSLAAAFVLGRRLFGPAAGLLGAAILAAAPRHLFSSSLFKPDITLLLVSLVALGWIFACAERPTLGRHLMAGVGIGLATAAKLNGAALAIPLIVLTLAEPRERRRWLGLVAAGVISVATFALVSPGFAGFVRDLGKNLGYYDRTADGGRAEALAEVLGFFGGTNFHGPILGLAALAGLVLIAVRARQRWPSPAASVLLAFVSFPPLYTLLYVAATPRAKANQFLQLLPFTSLAAAVALLAAARWLARRWPAMATRRARIAAIAGFAVYCLGAQTVHAYRLSVPSTRTRGLEAVSAALPRPCHGCVAVIEEDALPDETPPALLGQGVALRGVDDLAILPAGDLAGADAHVFLRRRHPGAVTGDGDEGPIRVIRPRLFVAWGPEVAVAAHPWGPPSTMPVAVTLAWDNKTLAASGAVPEAIADGAVVALKVRFRPGVRLRGWRAQLRIGGALVPLSRVGMRAREVTLATPRFPLAGRELEVRGPARRKGGRARITVEVLRWAEPWPG